MAKENMEKREAQKRMWKIKERPARMSVSNWQKIYFWTLRTVAKKKEKEKKNKLQCLGFFVLLKRYWSGQITEKDKGPKSITHFRPWQQLARDSRKGEELFRGHWSSWELGDEAEQQLAHDWFGFPWVTASIDEPKLPRLQDCIKKKEHPLLGKADNRQQWWVP